MTLLLSSIENFPQIRSATDVVHKEVPKLSETQLKLILILTV